MRVLLLSPRARPSEPADSDLRVVASCLLAALRTIPAVGDVAHAEVSEVHEIERAVREQRPTIVFNACETLGGRSAEEATVPRVLEDLGVAYTGSPADALGLASCKSRASAVLEVAGVAVPETLDPLWIARRSYPVIVKPEQEDGSVGIDHECVADDDEGVARALARLAAQGHPAIVQRYIDGREIAVALLGKTLRVLPPFEIKFDERVFAGRARVLTYAAKWDAASAEYRGTRSDAVDLEPALASRISDVALRAAHAIGMRGYGRVDVRVDRFGTPWVIDVNPNCDLSIDAGFMRAAWRAGLDYPDAIGEILSAAATS